MNSDSQAAVSGGDRTDDLLTSGVTEALAAGMSWVQIAAQLGHCLTVTVGQGPEDRDTRSVACTAIRSLTWVYRQYRVVEQQLRLQQDHHCACNILCSTSVAR